jgi:hypothetical protein
VILLVAIVASAAQAAPATIVAPEGDVRTLPRPDAAIIGVVERGQGIWVSDEAPNGWRRAQLGGDRTGYILDGQVRLEAPAAPARVRPRLARVERPLVVRLELNYACVGCWKVGPGALFGESDISDASSYALTLANSLSEAWAIEGTLGFARGGASVTVPAVGGMPAATSNVDLSPGTTLMLLARWAPLRSWWGRHALTVAGGPFEILGGAYGRVPFLHGEVAYEYRPPFPFTFLFGVGPDVALARSPSSVTNDCVNGLIYETCRRPFRSGDLFLHVRLGVGATF